MSRYVETIKKEILSWPYVVAEVHRFAVSKFVKAKEK
jgi:hypothetical protein